MPFELSGSSNLWMLLRRSRLITLQEATRDRSRFSNEALRWRSQEHNLGGVQRPLRGAMTYTSTMQSQQTLFCCNHMSPPDLLLATRGTMSTGTCSTHVALCTSMNCDSGVFDTQYSDIFSELWPRYKCDFSTTWPFYFILTPLESEPLLFSSSEVTYEIFFDFPWFTESGYTGALLSSAQPLRLWQ